ncbi:MAG: HNH endonuclease [Oligoflexia bacterium]|nr:HNH endonuclease [Oligoflexia bacterium]
MPHEKPICDGATHDLSNLKLLCFSCHRRIWISKDTNRGRRYFRCESAN